MGSTRSSFEPWIETSLRPRYPELEAPLLAAIDAFDAIQEQNRVSLELLGPIIDAASSSRRPLYENATEFLGALTGRFEEAREAVTRMSRDPKSQVRFNAILSVNSSKG